jgi:hypothetical protein
MAKLDRSRLALYVRFSPEEWDSLERLAVKVTNAAGRPVQLTEVIRSLVRGDLRVTRSGGREKDS